MDHFAYGRNAERDAAIRRVVYDMDYGHQTPESNDSYLLRRIEALEKHNEYLVGVLNVVVDFLAGQYGSITRQELLDKIEAVGNDTAR